jgi:glycosyltransferase involved in cell wall biosynthesis
VTAEALATGLPVVASNVGSVPDLVDHAVGRLCDVNDLDAFVTGIRALLRAESRATIIPECRARALERTGSAPAAEDHFKAYAVATRAA